MEEKKERRRRGGGGEQKLFASNYQKNYPSLPQYQMPISRVIITDTASRVDTTSPHDEPH
jgi:hypothetical protein